MSGTGIWDIRGKAEVVAPAVADDATDVEYVRAVNGMDAGPRNRWLRTLQTLKIIERIIVRSSGER